MSWEQMTFSFDDPKEAKPEQAEESRPEPQRTAFDDEFDAWVHRRSEFDKAFLRGMRMSAEQLPHTTGGRA